MINLLKHYYRKIITFLANENGDAERLHYEYDYWFKELFVGLNDIAKIFTTEYPVKLLIRDYMNSYYTTYEGITPTGEQVFAFSASSSLDDNQLILEQIIKSWLIQAEHLFNLQSELQYKIGLTKLIEHIDHDTGIYNIEIRLRLDARRKTL